MISGDVGLAVVVGLSCWVVSERHVSIGSICHDDIMLP